MEQLNTTSTADGEEAVGHARIEDDGMERNVPVVELLGALPRDQDHAFQRMCGAEGDGGVGGVESTLLQWTLQLW